MARRGWPGGIGTRGPSHHTVSTRQQVCVVTGGGGGIGAAVADELGRNGWFVVTVDPLVTLDGTETLPATEETTAGRIVAAGGSARADVSVGHRRSGTPRPVPNAGGRARGARRRRERRRHYAAVLLRPGQRGRLARTAQACISRATSTCSTPRCRSWLLQGTVTSSGSRPVRDGAPPTPAGTAAPSGPWRPSPGSSVARPRRA